MAALPPEIAPRCGHPRRERTDSPGNYTGAHQWCDACTKRWYRAGRPESGPPPPMPQAERAARSNRVRRQAHAARVAEYERLLAAGYTPPQAALRLRVTVATARRYDRLITRGERADAAA